MIKRDILDEVYSEKQRRWACYQMNAPKSEREISKSKATEMCKDVKHSKSKNEVKNPKMKKKDLVEYVNSKKSIKEASEPKIVREITRSDFTIIVKWLENLRKSGLINMFGASPLLCWTEDDLNRWLFGQRSDIESIESEIEDLEYENEDGEYDSEIESLERKKEFIQYLLDNKDSVRDVLIRVAMKRIENTTNNFELRNVQRVFEKMAPELFTMWATTVYG